VESPPASGLNRVEGLGELLRRLRLHAGLTQTQLAVALGFGARHGHTIVSQLERGKRTNPSLRLVLDFMRICRAVPADLTELLEQYLSKPVTVPQKPGRGRPRGPRKPKEDPAVLAMRKEAALTTLRQVCEKMLHFELNGLGAPAGSPVRQSAVMLGRAVFRILSDTRKADGAKREARIGRARKTAERQGSPEETVERVETKVKELFADMEREGDLDWLPDEAEAKSMMLRSGRRRLVTDAQMCRVEQARRMDEIQAELARRAQPIRAGAEQMVIAAGITDSRVGNYRSMVTGFLNVARSTVPGTDERRRKLDEMMKVSVRPSHDADLVRRIAEYVLAEWDRAQTAAGAKPTPSVSGGA